MKILLEQLNGTTPSGCWRDLKATKKTLQQQNS